MKPERAMRALSNGPTAGVCYVRLDAAGCDTAIRT